MIDTKAIERWLAAYVQAWTSDAPEEIGGLFTSDARYYTAPYREPIVGSDAIGDWWIEQGESDMRWSFEHDVLAQEADCYVVRNTTTYPETPGPNGKPQVFRNIWLVTLTADGLASEFIEYWMLEE